MAKNTANLNETDTEQVQDQSFSRELYEWFEAILTALMMVIVVMIFFLRPANVEGPSMENTLHENDRLIFTDIGFTPEYGDIVIVDSEGLGKFIVKRVIATEGQTVDIDFANATVAVDGVILDEKYISTVTANDEAGHEYPVAVPPNSVFVMGDNRMHSTDSRSARVGFVNVDDIYGKVIFRFYPFSKMGVVE
ncbi:MAG: signal peptidase I [Ruminococcus sp.]|jgi:signal peptidase I|nr:signal peptidase I [Ruminococcus sp.]